MFFLIWICIDLADNLLQELFLICLRWIKLNTLSKSLSSPALNKSREERIRNTLFVTWFFFKRSWCIFLLVIVSLCWFIALSCSIFKPVLLPYEFMLIWRGSLRINTICLAVLWLRCTNRKIFKIAAFNRHYTASTGWKDCTCTIYHTDIFSGLSTLLRRTALSFSFWLKEDFTILV